jgi:hypothetical protein
MLKTALAEDFAIAKASSVLCAGANGQQTFGKPEKACWYHHEVDTALATAR